MRSHGKRVLFWADIEAGARIFNKYPELVEKLPADVVPVPWYYAAKPDYTPWVEPFGKARKPQVIAPGVTCWNEIFPDYTTTFTNIDGFMAAGRKHGAIGVINTGWTDDAQTIYRMALPGMAYGAVASWQPEPVERKTFFNAYAGQMYAGELARDVGTRARGSVGRARLAGRGDRNQYDASFLGGRARTHAAGESGISPRATAPGAPASLRTRWNR